MRHGLLVIALLTGLALCGAGDGFANPPVPAPEQVRFFETSIRPLLAEHCYQCHGTEKQRSDLRLDSREALTKGGASGEPAVVPGQPDKSLLIQAVRHQGELQMPPKQKLTERQVADLTRWVRMGAPYPAAVAGSQTEGKFWAFQ